MFATQELGFDITILPMTTSKGGSLFPLLLQGISNGGISTVSGGTDVLKRQNDASGCRPSAPRPGAKRSRSQPIGPCLPGCVRLGPGAAALQGGEAAPPPPAAVAEACPCQRDK